jgi:hypothetical protein
MKGITFKRGHYHWKVIYKGAEVGIFHDICSNRPNTGKGRWTFNGCDGYTGRGKTRLLAIADCIKERKRLFSLADVKELNREAGQYFFSRDTMRFFNSHIEGALLKGGYFVTSETQNYNTPRKYTARKVDYLNGSISTLGEFNECSTKDGAKYQIKADRDNT